LISSGHVKPIHALLHPLPQIILTAFSAFQWAVEFWLDQQAHYDRQVTEGSMRPVLARIKPCALSS